jgi:hypothetical protein
VRVPLIPGQDAADGVELVIAAGEEVAAAGIDDHFGFDWRELEAVVPGAAIGKTDALVLVAVEDERRRFALLDEGQRRAAAVLTSSSPDRPGARP